jgi:glycosyltransferase involved in cell wall biosynthesis/GT2 family glycosyltransferase/Flp pilus assembly protein TadD
LLPVPYELAAFGAAGVKLPALTRISLNVIVFNEEARLEECLSDARDFVDEIVVVDQMSTDGTPEIAQRLADVYIRDLHHGHAEPSRELAASRSSGEWILILDADEKMSDILKAELPSLVEGDADGYWIRKVNFVGGTETSTILHYRLVRKSRVRFDPRPHGGATAVSENVEHFEQIGIIHEKSVDEQIFDDARYERMALEDDAPTSAKRNWLSHNHTLRQQRERRRRGDLETLVPAGASRVLILGDIPIELPGCTVVRLDRTDPTAIGREGAPDAKPFDAVVVALAGDDLQTTLPIVADLVRPGGVIVGTASAARNRRRIEEVIAAVVSDGTRPDAHWSDGSTRRELLDELSAVGLDVRWMRLVRDGWLNPVALRPDGTGSVVESEDFLLKSVPAEVAEELTAEEIVFAALRQQETEVPECSVILVALAGTNPHHFADALRDTQPHSRYELVVVQSQPGMAPIAGATSVMVAEELGLAARRNAGARAAAGELLVFVSADAMPLPSWLDTVVQAHRSRPDTGAVGSKVIAQDGTIEHAGLVLGPDRIPYRLYQGDSAMAPAVNRPRIMPAVAAEGMITARARFVEVGGLDETLGDDLSDADFCMRLRARGFPILYAPGAVLRSSPRSVPGTGGDFRASAREFVARWASGFRSDELVCTADGSDVNWESNRSWRLPRPAGPRVGGVPTVAWTSHFFERGGYTEEAIAAVEALDAAGLSVVANPLVWDRGEIPMPARKFERLTALMDRDLPSDFVHVVHIGADRFKRHPAAMRNIGRTMFETDGLSAEWRDQCNAMDEVWVPSEHNLRTFARAGVAASKLHKVPETFDIELFHPGVTPLPIEGAGGFVFLSMFSWIDRKAWGVLLRAWFEEFGRQDDVTLILKTDTAISPAGTDCRHEIESFVRDQLKCNPKKGPRIIVLDRPLEVTDVPRLYRAADAFVLASHGEGWGRPYMEAMAMGLPTIATRWSGNLEFMNDDNSYLIDYQLVDAGESSWLRGQRWAEPSVRDLRRAMRRVYEHRTEAVATGERARADVLVSCSPELLVAAVRERVEAVDRHPVHVSTPSRAELGPFLAPSVHRRPTKDGRRITACVVVSPGGAPSLSQCLSSLRGVDDSTVVVEAGPNEDMAAVRNEALDRATGGWMLMLDATQTLDPASVDVVRDLVDQGRFIGYTARELHQFGLDGAVSSVEQRKAVLFPRHPDLRYVGSVAEQLLSRRPDLVFRLAPSRVVLHQHDSRNDVRDPVARARRDLPVLQRSVRAAPNEPFHLYNLAIALACLGLLAEAETAMRKAITRAPAGVIWGASAHATLSRAVAAQGRAAEAVKLCKVATKLAPDWAQGWCMLGAALVDSGRQKAALRAYARALECVGETWLPPGDPDDTVWQVRAAMGKIHFGFEQYDEAAECLSGAVALRPDAAELRVWLARVYEAVGRSADARHHLERAVTVARTGPEAYVAFGDFFTKRAEGALLRGLADNAESRVLLERIERLRATRALA